MAHAALARATQRAYLVAQIRHRRALGIAKPRTRIPRQLEPNAIRVGYLAMLRPVLAAAQDEIRRLVVPHLAEWVETSKRLRGDDHAHAAEHASGLVRIGLDGDRDLDLGGQVVEDESHDLCFQGLVEGAKTFGGVVRQAQGKLDGQAFAPDLESPARAPRALATHAPSLPRLDSAISAKDAIDRAVEAFNRRQEAQRANLERIADTTARRTSDFQREQLNRQARAALGVELPPFDVGLQHRIQEFTTVNVALIQNVTATYYQQVEAKVLDGVRSGRRWEDIAADIAERGDVSESRAALIARDQVGKFYGSLNSARQQAAGVTSFVWRTVHDNRVREEHQQLDGDSFEWTNPPAEGIPGEPVNCRCNAEPDFSGVLAEVIGE